MFSRLLGVTLVALFSLKTLVVATPTDADRLYDIGRRDGDDSICANEPTPDVVSAMEDDFAASLAQNPDPDGVTPAGQFTVLVNFHVIYASKDPSRGYVPDYQLQDQIDVLNKDFRDVGLAFELHSTTRTLNEDWFNNMKPNSDKETQMKKLRRGDVRTLNVYTVALRDYLGYTTFPADYKRNSQKDGVILRFTTLPGGTADGYDEGRILTHHVGHWVGLYHTFQGGCDGKGDYVADTPAEKSAASGCRVGRDTCPGPGADPIHNFMDYSSDQCRDNFTPGQVTRLKQQLSTYRGIKL